MTRRARASRDTEVIPRGGGPRHTRGRQDHHQRRDTGGHRMRAGGRVLAVLAAVLVLAGTGMGWASYRNITGGITTSQARGGRPASTGGDKKILIMGLGRRLDP